MNITLTINEQTVSKIIEAVAKAFAQPAPTPSVPIAPQPSQELEALQKKVASLQKELAQAKAQASQTAKPVATAEVAKPEPQAQAVAKPPVTEIKPVVEPQASSQVEPKQQETAKEEALKPVPQAKPISEAPSQAKPNGNGNGNGSHCTPPTAEKAEEWVRKNMGEWLDQSCRYAKAQKRTWRELATNVGDKIEVKGKPAVPRAYLHALEAWDTCNMWDRVKAKVALEFGKNGNGSHVTK